MGSLFFFFWVGQKKDLFFLSSRESQSHKMQREREREIKLSSQAVVIRQYKIIIVNFSFLKKTT